jgi:hypothetical protein
MICQGPLVSTANISETQTLVAVQEAIASHVENSGHRQKICKIIANFLFELPILCVEVGGTRIKFGALPKTLTFEKLQTLQTKVFSSEGWVGPKLPSLFRQSPESPLVQYLEMPHSKISLSVTGPVFHHRTHLWPTRRGIPRNLSEVCEKEAGCEVVIDNDSTSWAKGCLAYLKLKNVQPKFPCLGITIGTGVGGVLIRDENSVCGIEIDSIDCGFSRLKALVHDQPMEKWSPHRTVGKKFFELLFNGQSFLDEQMKPHLAKYNERFYALVHDIREVLEKTFALQFAELFVGGGFSRFIEVSKALSLPTTIFNPQFLEKESLSPDIIQLLGCHNTCQEKHPVSNIYPHYDQLLKIVDAAG